MVNHKKIGVLILSCMFLLGEALVPCVSLASPTGSSPGENVAGATEQLLAELLTLGIDKEAATKYLNPGIDPRELGLAATMAKVSGKSFVNVLQMKNLANTWTDVEQALGITKEQLHAFHLNMMADQMEEDFAIPRQTALDLLTQKYNPQDILAANVLATAAHKTIDDVLVMKKINNKWKDVAQTLGVDVKVLNLPMKLGRAYVGPPAPGTPVAR
ncbi:hypothetical protein SPSIL_057700 [Sporomusa silvacetica DSM 10669]|uniref:Uncharacterized protein n=1 Tax=Sporomusa silvacetica DSM 10669 TaxID=1123289 RepID=A0ABZ3IUY0_9FIRM|nr:hypothetical protein [Sporomusa silvacetica]OZC14282.1 hypothetical protein SPSIL_50090 [Sporomusa silvacetica DSM 10669]